MSLALSESDRSLLEGEAGQGLALAMRVMVRVAEAMEARSLLDITAAHIDGCLYLGPVGLDFVQRVGADGARVRVPTTLNVGSIDLLHPELNRGGAAATANARALMAEYERLGCRPTWTCAPYQLESRPAFGEQVAWAESNAIVFANSVLGARTHRYGDFVDLCAAVTGRAPAAGLHLEENRRARVVFDVSGLSARLLGSDVLFPVLGHLIGARVGSLVPAIVGLSSATEDQLKSLGAAAAASGAVAMFHAVGITPEAPDLETALGGAEPERVVAVSLEMITRARDQLTSDESGAIRAVTIGTPHASLAQMSRIAELLDGRRVAESVQAYVSTGRDVAAQADAAGISAALEAGGFTVVTDTCTYVAPIIHGSGPVMTDSAKWAYYAPANIGVSVVFGSLTEVIESAVAGRLRRDPELWTKR